MLIAGSRLCMAVLMSMATCLCGCIEVDQRIRVHDDAAVSVNATTQRK